MVVARKRRTKLHENHQVRAPGRNRVLSVKGPGVVDPPSPEALPTIASAMDLLTGANRQPAMSSH